MGRYGLDLSSAARSYLSGGNIRPSSNLFEHEGKPCKHRIDVFVSLADRDFTIRNMNMTPAGWAWWPAFAGRKATTSFARA